MQTNKNVAEWGSHYIGAEICANSLELYSRAGEWYLAAPKLLLKRHYPIIYDSVYLNKNNELTVEVMGSHIDGSEIYMPISAGTARVLQRSDGYAELKTLLAESYASGKKALSDLPGAQKHPILAELATAGDDDRSVYYISECVPEQPSSGMKYLSMIDKYTVDVIGTVVYNVAIPVMAPFRFFSEFLSED